MKIVLINKSDKTGGAAVVTFRLMEALRAAGHDAEMLVAEKCTDSPYVHLAASKATIKLRFYTERLRIFAASGWNRPNLFKIDTAWEGLPLWRHPKVRQADAILLGWVNQGMLSLRGVEKILALGKPVLWTMHDMWNMTGVCHHAGSCNRYRGVGECGDCPLLGRKGSPRDISHTTWDAKHKLYEIAKQYGKIAFVPVSSWLEGCGRKSSLMSQMRMEVIPNAFDPLDIQPAEDGRMRITIGAARLDDDVKGFPILIETCKALRTKYPELAEEVELVTFGGMRDATLFDKIAVSHRHVGFLDGEEVARLLAESDVALSTSLYETLPTTMIEGQSYGAIPVCTDHGGQRDIVEHRQTGYLAEWSDDKRELGERLADGIAWALRAKKEDPGIITRMKTGVISKFSAATIAARYIRLIESLSSIKRQY